MIAELNFLDLLKAIRTCVNKPHYHIGIFTDTIANAKRTCAGTYDLIKEDIEMLSAVDGRIDRSTDQFITFSNGSYIRFIGASTGNIRGHRFHRVLYMKEIPHDIVYLLSALQMRYMEEDSETSR